MTCFATILFGKMVFGANLINLGMAILSSILIGGFGVGTVSNEDVGGLLLTSKCANSRFHLVMWVALKNVSDCSKRQKKIPFNGHNK